MCMTACMCACICVYMLRVWLCECVVVCWLAPVALPSPLMSRIKPTSFFLLFFLLSFLHFLLIFDPLQPHLCLVQQLGKTQYHMLFHHSSTLSFISIIISPCKPKKNRRIIHDRNYSAKFSTIYRLNNLQKRQRRQFNN